MAKRSRPVGIGLVGMGFMGLTHLRAARRLKRGRLVALVTSDPRKARGDFGAVGGNFGGGGSREDLDGLTIYPTLDELLADEKVDLVDICLPSYLHAKAALKCMKAGKSVLVEKPIALKPADSRRMLETSRRTGQLLLVAQVLKFMPEFALLREALADGRWGALRALHLRRLISVPDWSDDSWLSDPARSGGMIIDLHIHDTDFVVDLMGRPRAVSSQGLASNGQVDFIRTTYHYSRKGPLLSSEAGWINAGGLPFEHGYDGFFDEATVHFNSTEAPQPRLHTAKRSRPIKLRGVDGFAREIQAAVDSVRNGKADPLLSAKSAAAALEVCLAERLSVRKGEKVWLR